MVMYVLSMICSSCQVCLIELLLFSWIQEVQHIFSTLCSSLCLSNSFHLTSSSNSSSYYPLFLLLLTAQIPNKILLFHHHFLLLDTGVYVDIVIKENDIYVDIVIKENDIAIISQPKEHLCYHFQPKDLWSLKYFLSIKVVRWNRFFILKETGVIQLIYFLLSNIDNTTLYCFQSRVPWKDPTQLSVVILFGWSCCARKFVLSLLDSMINLEMC